LLVDYTSFTIPDESSHDSSATSSDGSFSEAFSPCSSSLSVDDASLTVCQVSSNDSSSNSSASLESFLSSSVENASDTFYDWESSHNNEFRSTSALEILSMESSIKSAVSASSLESSDNNEFVVPANGSSNTSLLPDHASVWSSVESSNNSGTSELSLPTAFGELLETSLVDGALLSLSGEFLNDFSSFEVESSPSVCEGASSLTSGEDLPSLTEDKAFAAISHELLDNSLSEVPADSLLDWSLLIQYASTSSSSESSDNFGTSHSTGPFASGELVLTSLVGNALLSLSGESSDDL